MKIHPIIIAYGVFLILAGLAGYLSNPEKAKTALLSGGLFGSIQIVLGLLRARGWKPAAGIALGVGAFLAATFTWRATVGWMAVAQGNEEKLFASVLISIMLAATLALIGMLLVAMRRPASQ